MQDNKPDLALSRTFRLEGGILSAADQAEQWAQAINSYGAASRAALTSGTVVDSKYRVLSLVGSGGMGSVYRVQHLLLSKEMALKTFNTTQLDAESWTRFQREAQSIAKLTHANIVQVFDFGISGNEMPYYTMELLSGQSLNEKILGAGQLTPAQALPIFQAAAAALAHAHKLGIIHRDIKPANIFLNRTAGGKELVKVVDFGIAKLATAQNYDEQSQTESGLVFGSPLYMSPEQSLGEVTDGRTDIYSFGCSLFEALAGRPPFLGKNALETITMHHHKKPPSLVEASGTNFSSALESFVAKLLAKNREDRQQTFEQVLDDLTRLMALENSQTGPISRSLFGSGRLLENNRDRLAAYGFLQGQTTTQGSSGSRPSFRGQLIYFAGAGVTCLVLAAAGALALYVAPRLIPVKKVSASASTASANATDTAANDIINAATGASTGAAIEDLSAAANSTSGATEAAAEDLEKSLLPEGRGYYSIGFRDGSKQFRFPPGLEIGTFSYNGSGKEYRAVNVMSVPSHTEITFRPGEVVLQKPEILKYFRSDDFKGFTCNSVILPGWNDRHVDAASRYLSDLEGLDLSSARLTDKSVEYFNRLKRLNRLIVSDAGLTGKDLVGMHRLLQLTLLDAQHIKDAPLMLKQLAHSKELRNMSLDECGLTDDDLKTIGQISTLIGLSVSGNAITLEGIKNLLPLKELHNLEVIGPKLGPEAIGVFAQFKGLLNLKFLGEGWTEADRAKLHKLLPKCYFNDSKPKSDEIMDEK